MHDLEILAGREKVSFAVDEEVKNAVQNEIIPFWIGQEQPRQDNEPYDTRMARCI